MLLALGLVVLTVILVVTGVGLMLLGTIAYAGSMILEKVVTLLEMVIGLFEQDAGEFVTESVTNRDRDDIWTRGSL